MATSTALTLNLNSQLAVLSQDVERYTQAVKTVPILTAEEERELTERYHQTGDLEAARILVLTHLRFVLHIANGYRGYGLSQADIIQEGNVGLMKAVKRFDPQVGVRLITFAVHWIKAEIHEFILRNWRIVKVATTKAQRKLFFNLRSSKTHLGWMTQKEVDDIAKDLGVTSKDVLEMEKRMTMPDMAFDAPADSDDEDMPSPAQYLQDTRYDPAQLIEDMQWETQNYETALKAYEQLDERSQDIIKRRWLDDNKATLHELADKYQVSAERIRQIETSALKKLRKQLMELN